MTVHCEHQRMISSENLDRCIIRMLLALKNSRMKSLSLTPSRLFSYIESKPSRSAEYSRSIGTYTLLLFTFLQDVMQTFAVKLHKKEGLPLLFVFFAYTLQVSDDKISVFPVIDGSAGCERMAPAVVFFSDFIDNRSL